MGRRRELSLLEPYLRPQKIWFGYGPYALRWTKEREKHRINMQRLVGIGGRGRRGGRGGRASRGGRGGRRRAVRGRRNGLAVQFIQCR